MFRKYDIYAVWTTQEQKPHCWTTERPSRGRRPSRAESAASPASTGGPWTPDLTARASPPPFLNPTGGREPNPFLPATLIRPKATRMRHWQRRDGELRGVMRRPPSCFWLDETGETEVVGGASSGPTDRPGEEGFPIWTPASFSTEEGITRWRIIYRTTAAK